MADHEDKYWIGVDLDATLAVFRGWKGPKHIGKPIPKMVRRVKRWLKEGKKVKIFTARVAGDNGTARRAIQKFCKQVFGQVLPITNRKDQYCKTVWDDRSHNMKANTGDQMNKAAFLQGYLAKQAETSSEQEMRIAKRMYRAGKITKEEFADRIAEVRGDVNESGQTSSDRSGQEGDASLEHRTALAKALALQATPKSKVVNP